ncbi:hypothetical protein [Rhizobacter sp. Root1221]|uniref:hypothetical protein n=1 Tax=Rhizobacter sp. Root1221 TaxID=1736433 RepID=UPI0006F254BB|nr:hypothetical protein [Rhizobacter sp. Root1221]KQV99959.1 hypothetical protein ASC87_19860 [Rhizobacter sp. Root1221]
MSKHTAAIFAHQGYVSAIAFKGEPLNFNGTLVKELAAETHEALAEQLGEVTPVGVGSPWPPVGAVKAAKPAKASKE